MFSTSPLNRTFAAMLVMAALALPSTGSAAEPKARESAPKSEPPAKKVRKARAAKPPAPAVVVDTQPDTKSVTTRYEEIELIPVPPPAPTPAAELAQ